MLKIVVVRCPMCRVKIVVVPGGGGTPRSGERFRVTCPYDEHPFLVELHRMRPQTIRKDLADEVGVFVAPLVRGGSAD